MVSIRREEVSKDTCAGRGEVDLNLGVSTISSRLTLRKWSMMSGQYFDKSSSTSSVFCGKAAEASDAKKDVMASVSLKYHHSFNTL